MINWAQMGDPNASIPTAAAGALPPDVRRASAALCSPPASRSCRRRAIDTGVPERLGLRAAGRGRARHAAAIGKRDMVRNDATPRDRGGPGDLQGDGGRRAGDDAAGADAAAGRSCSSWYERAPGLSVADARTRLEQPLSLLQLGDSVFPSGVYTHLARAGAVLPARARRATPARPAALRRVRAASGAGAVRCRRGAARLRSGEGYDVASVIDADRACAHQGRV